MCHMSVNFICLLFCFVLPFFGFILVSFCFCFCLDVFVAGFACFLIGQPTHAAPPGITQNSNTRWQHEPSMDGMNQFDRNKFVSLEDNESSIPESVITETEMTSDTIRQKRDAEKKACRKYDGIDPCLPCHGDGEYFLPKSFKLLTKNNDLVYNSSLSAKKSGIIY